MFMRYRGGGIGHKYMREVEAKYENMSRERLHGKQPHRERGPPQETDEPGDASDSDGGPEDPARPGAPRQGGPATGSPGSDGDGNEDDEVDEDNDYVPSETGSSSEGVVDSDEIASDFDYDSYGLADP